ncbi:hypothetical protein REPUB_Repub06bG0134400 [Reevesia pubescens]
MDVFILRKRSQIGRKFRFVHYAFLVDTRCVVNLLNGVWLMDYRIGVYMAKFNGRSSFWKKVNLSSTGPGNVIVENLASNRKGGLSDSELNGSSNKLMMRNYINRRIACQEKIEELEWCRLKEWFDEVEPCQNGSSAQSLDLGRDAVIINDKVASSVLAKEKGAAIFFDDVVLKTDVSYIEPIPFSNKLKVLIPNGLVLGLDNFVNVGLKTEMSNVHLPATNLEPAIGPSATRLALIEAVEDQMLEEEAEYHSFNELIENSKNKEVKNNRGAKLLADVEDLIIDKVDNKSR